MMKKHMLLALLLACAFCFCSCSAAPAVTAPVVQTQDRVLQDARSQYRDASLIVSATCIRKHTDASGHVCSDVVIEQVLAGNAACGDILHCTDASLSENDQSLLYLNVGEDVDYAEDGEAFLLCAEPHRIIDNEVIWHGCRVPLDVISDDIQELSSEITLPTPLYYYTNIKGIVDAADEILIGRVVASSPSALRTFALRSSGMVEKRQMDTSMVLIEAYGSMKGTVNYGDILQLVHSESLIPDMINANTLQPFGYAADVVPPYEKSGVYLFFLMKGPDDKQDYYFGVNPLQGSLRIYGEQVDPFCRNELFAAYDALTPLVQDIQKALQSNAADESPALLISE